MHKQKGLSATAPLFFIPYYAGSIDLTLNPQQ